MKNIFILLSFLFVVGCVPATTDSGSKTPPVVIIDAEDKG